MNNNVTKENKISRKDWAIIILITCLTSLSIAYATISTTLIITNELTVKAQNWDIHFENLEQESITGSNTARVITPATIEEDTTKISGLQVEFKKPGDYVSYTFDIKNSGDINAILTSINIGTPTCKPESTLCDDIEYIVKYDNGDDIKVTDELSKDTSIKVRLTIRYKSSSTQIVNEDITVNGLDAAFTYAQK